MKLSLVIVPPGVQTMLDLSTGHMPSTSPEWGKLRVVEHEHGFIAFVNGDTTEKEEIEEIEPEWIRPLMAYARDSRCMLVNFDMDAEVVDALPYWEW